MPYKTYPPLSEYAHEWSVCGQRPPELSAYKRLEEENQELKYEIYILNYQRRLLNAASLEIMKVNEIYVPKLWRDLEQARRMVENLTDMNIQAEKDRRRLELGMSVNQGKLDRVRAVIIELDELRPRPKGAGWILYVIKGILN